jgi:hypothetical protein
VQNESPTLSSAAKVLAFAAAAEVGTGLAAMIVPAVVVQLLLGLDVSAEGAVLARCFGVAVLALGIACLPNRRSGNVDSAALRAMLIYNALIASYLSYLGGLVHLAGVLLWPGAALHAIVVAMLLLTRRDAPRGGR